MDIAVIGAGRIGSAFAFRLARAGHAVTLIARGSRLGELQHAGTIATVDGTSAKVQAVSELDIAIPFDLVLVTVLAHQVETLLPTLKKSAAKAVLFMFNTFDPVEPLREAVGAERFAFGFPNMMAFFVDGKLKSVVDGPGMVTTVTSAQWARILKDAGLPTEVETDMTSFLRTHAAFYVPTLAAALLTWKRDTNLSWSEASRLTTAMLEAFDVVRDLGHTIRPASVAMVARLPRFVLVALFWLFARTSAVKNLGEFGPTEARTLIDAMTAAAPGKTNALVAIRP